MRNLTQVALVRRRQDGAVIITVALLLLFLLGFAGIALDFGHLFIVRSELQTAMDSCALAAAQELDGRADALTRATSAGITAGNLNRVDLQSADWRNQGRINAANVSFYNAAFVSPAAAADARYVQCEHAQNGVQMWLMHAMGAFFRDTTNYPQTRGVGARAVATRSSAQTTCPIPVALKPKGTGTKANNWGLQIGEWVTVYGDKTPGGGEMGWYNLDATKSAHNTKSELSEVCGTRINETVPLGTPGAQTSVFDEWNQRFGIYKNNVDHAANPPDFSGYSYTSFNWTNAVPQNAWSGEPATGSHPKAENFLTKRGKFASFDDTGTDLKHGSEIVFNQKNALNSYKDVATPGAGGEHQLLGSNRRVALVPVLDDANKIQDFACMFMLHPLTGPHDPGHMEFLGPAGALNSPCTTSGIPGGVSGPLVPVLVR